MEHDTREGLRDVEAVLNYLIDTGEKPAVYLYPPPPGTPQRTGRYTTSTVTIRDGRALLPQLALDKQGFLLQRHETKVMNFYDEHEVQAVYYPEVERLVQAVTGAAKVVVFDHTWRCASADKRAEHGAEEPVRMAHNDYTPRSGPQRVRDLLAADEAEARLRRRFVEINVWRPIRGPVEGTPLAVCDGQTIAPQDLVATDLKYRDRTGEVYVLTFNPRHRWYYFPRMQSNEALLLKGYDSLTDGRTRFTAHTAFDDPTAPPQAAARESIEIRTLVFF
ncbi:MAG TPA: CmcJ/NvfI family oxidoreductase [Candidatus Binatia bacterium]|nr:CmcJ/NvfI family oxidoreductase [Candidatus Binatia bacterium]